MANRLLIIEDEALMLQELERHYRRIGWNVALASSIQEARTLLKTKGLTPLVVISDMSLPDGNALDLLEEVRADSDVGEWIFLTGYGTVADSVRALRLGAFDFLEKPADFQRLDLVVAGAARSAKAQRRLRDQAHKESARYTPQSFVGGSLAAQRVRDMLSRLCEVPFSALVISGETGTGKGVAAKILHHAGPRTGGPLIDINCSALPKDLLESELFGHEAGAFTGAKGLRRGLMEQADGGTLFLDEIGEMPLDLQAKLLKAIEEKTFRRVGGDQVVRVDVQVIAATNRDLAAQVRDGSFREDLYHRLSVFRLDVPPLRERLDDLDELVPLFIGEFNAKSGRRVSTVPEPVWQRLRQHRWPGNVRELRNVIERCVLFARDDKLPIEWLQLTPAREESPRQPTVTSTPHDAGGRDSDSIRLPLNGSLGLDDIDRLVIEAALARHHHNVTAAARALNTTRDTLRYRIRKYGISPSNGHDV